MKSFFSYLKSKFIEVVIAILLVIVSFQLMELKHAVYYSGGSDGGGISSSDIQSIKSDLSSIRSDVNAMSSRSYRW